MLHLCEVLVAIVRQVFGLAEVEERIYVASSCLETRGIFCYSPANDSVGSGAVPGRVLVNSTASCCKVHGIAFLKSQESLVFTDAATKLLRSFPYVTTLSRFSLEGANQAIRMEARPNSISRLQFALSIILFISVTQLSVVSDL